MKNTSPEEFLKSRPWIDLASTGEIERYIAAQPKDELNEQVLPTLLDWHRNGYAILRNAVPAATVDRLQEEIAFIRAHYESFDLFIDGTAKHYKKRKLAELKPEDLQDVGLKLCDLHRISPTAAEIAMNPVILRFLKHIFGGPAALLQSLSFNKSSEQAIHQDFSFVYGQRDVAKLAACWVALEDISPDSGPLEYYAGSHQLAQKDFFNWGENSVHLVAGSEANNRFKHYLPHLQQQLSEHKWQKQIFLPRKGDVLMWHGALLHGGTPMKNASLTRKSFVCHYSSLESHQSFPDRVGDGYIFSKTPKRIEQAMLPKDGRTKLRRFAARLKKRVLGD